MNPTKEQLADPKWWDENAPEGTTGAMVAHFDSGEIRRGDVEFIPSDEPCRSIYKEGPDWWVYHPAPSATDWTGEGLPPVGTRCVFDGEEGEIVAHVISNSKSSAIIQLDDDWWPADAEELSPLRTPEQIAAEEQNKAVSEMMTHVVHATPIDCELLYRAGYRKQEQTK